MYCRGSRSIIVLAMNYCAGEKNRGHRPPLQGESPICWGDDYHQCQSPEIEGESTDFLQTVGRTQIFYVIPPGFGGWSAILLGRRGRLGIARDHSVTPTWHLVFFGCILTTSHLAPDLPPISLWNLFALIYACPTGAIVSPHQSTRGDASLNLTIEHKRPSRLELRPLIATDFRCDDCLDACP